MSNFVIEIEKISKIYKIKQGTYHSGQNTLREEIKDYFSRIRKKTTSTESVRALYDISLQVSRGEIVGIIGKNGSGKSTLLKILAGITRPTSGRASIVGRVGLLLEVGTGFHSELTGRENIFLSGSILGMTRREIVKKYDQIVEFSEIEKYLDTPVKRYSSGMAVRLAFSVLVHLYPDVLLIDEVLSVGDQGFQEKSLSKILEISQQGCTILYVSHNLKAVESYCERVVLLDKGEMAMDSKDTRKVIASYLEYKNETIKEDSNLILSTKNNGRYYENA